MIPKQILVWAVQLVIVTAYNWTLWALRMRIYLLIY
jgi:hypothetical protein